MSVVSEVKARIARRHAIAEGGNAQRRGGPEDSEA
jgi:hypothetical protein